ncbi:MAG: hypothetical protein HRU43_04145, partial [Simkaniaceae bacterium]|nr:hypothetical protein [Simkaniaceae bacterium]
MNNISINSGITGAALNGLETFSTKSQLFQVIDNQALRRFIPSYGQTPGVVKSVALAIICSLVVYFANGGSRVSNNRSDFEGANGSLREDQELKPNLAENRLQSLQNPLEIEPKMSIEDKIQEAREKGYGPIWNKGCNGSRIYRDSTGKKIGIFKADTQSRSLIEIIKDVISYIFGIRRQPGYLPMPENRFYASMISERASFLFDKAFGTHCIPETEIITVAGTRGSFQHFLESYEEAESCELPDGSNEKSLEIFQRFAILDFILGNLDRKLDNWMVKFDQKTKEFDAIGAIDNANCFPRGHLPALIQPIAGFQLPFLKGEYGLISLSAAQKS